MTKQINQNNQRNLWVFIKQNWQTIIIGVVLSIIGGIISTLILWGITKFFKLTYAIPIIIFMMIWFISTLLLYKHTSLKSYRKQIEKEYDAKFSKEVEKGVIKKLKKYEPDDRTLYIINMFLKIIRIFKPLMQVNNKYSFREVFSDVGKGLNSLHYRFLSKILILENWFWSIQQQTKTSYNWKEWLEELCSIIRAIEETAKDFGDQREKWFVNFNKANMNKLIDEYTLFINQLKLFYVELDWDEPGFRSLRSLLLGDDVKK